MGVCKLIASGKWSTNANWENAAKEAKKPSASEDVHIPAGKEVKIEAAAECRSLYVEGNAKVTSNTSNLLLGNSEKPEGPAGARWILKVDSEATISGWIGQLEWFSSYTAEELKISVVPTMKTPWEWETEKSAKLLLEENLATDKTINMRTGAVLNTNGKTVKAERLQGSAGAKVKLTLGASVVTLTGALAEAVWQGPSGSEATFSGASATIKLTGAKAQFAGAGLTYGTLILEAAEQAIEGSNTFSTLEAKTKGLAATKFAKGSTQTVTTFAHNGASGELVKLVSSEAGKAWTLKKASGNVNTDFLELTDSHVDATPKWYAGTHSTNVSGNENWLFEAEPGGSVVGKATGTMLLTGTATALLRSVVTGKATGALLLTGTSSGTLRVIVKGSATGTLLLTGTSTGSLTETLLGKATGTILLTGSSKGSLASNVTGSASGHLLLTGRAKALRPEKPARSAFILILDE